MSDIRVKVGADISNLRTGLQSAKAEVGKFSSEAGNSISGFGAKVAGAFSVAAIIQFARSLGDTIGAIQDSSDRLDITAESVQSLTAFFGEGGAKAEHFEKGMIGLNASLVEAQARNPKTIASFAQLGITWDDIVSKSPEDILYKISNAMHASGNESQKSAALFDLMGKAAYKLKPGLKEGSEAMRTYAEGMSKFTNDEVKKVDAAFDEIGRKGKKLLVDAVHFAAAAWDALGEIGKMDKTPVAGDDFNRPLQTGKRSEPDYGAENPDPDRPENPAVTKFNKDNQERKDAEAKLDDELAAARKKDLQKQVEEGNKIYLDGIEREKRAKEKQVEEEKRLAEEMTQKLKEEEEQRVRDAKDAADRINSARNAAVANKLSTPDQRRQAKRTKQHEERAGRSIDQAARNHAKALRDNRSPAPDVFDGPKRGKFPGHAKEQFGPPAPEKMGPPMPDKPSKDPNADSAKYLSEIKASMKSIEAKFAVK